MVDLKNWEMFAGTASPVVGANVSVYVATDTHPNPNSATSTTTTDNNGMWAFTGLAGGTVYDVKVEYSGRTKWYKGNTKHVIGHLTDDTTPDANRNLIPNGGLDLWNKVGASSVSLPTSDPGVENIADGWTAYLGSGDSGTGQRDGVALPGNGLYSLKVAYTRSAGQARAYRDLPAPIWQQLKGQVVSASFQVLQSVATSKLAVFIDDGVGVTTGTVTDVTDAWATISATRTINAGATKVRIGVVTARADTGAKTFYVDNAMADLTSAAPTYAPEMIDAGPSVMYATIDDTVVPTVDGEKLTTLLSNFGSRLKAISGEISWRATPATSLAGLVAIVNSLASSVLTLTSSLAGKVNKTGDTMSGGLTLSAGNLILTLGSFNAGVGSVTAASGDFTALAKNSVAVSRFVAGTYSGNGSATQNIAVGFQPSFVVIRRSGTTWWFLDPSTDALQLTIATGNLGQTTINFHANGFVASTFSGTNTNSVSYSYQAFG